MHLDVQKDFTHVIRLYHDRTCQKESFVGSGLLIGHQHVLTCEHVGEQLDSRSHGAPWYARDIDETIVEVQNSGGPFRPGKDFERNPSLIDLAVFRLSGTDIQGNQRKQRDQYATVIRDVPQQYWDSIPSHSLWVLGGPDLVPGRPGTIQYASARNIQVAGGIEPGYSGGPVVMNRENQWVYVGIAWYGGTTAATSRILTGHTVHRFLTEREPELLNELGTRFLDVPSPLTTIEQYEAVLARYSIRCLEEWHDGLLGGAFGRNDRLDHYVEPHYSLLKTSAQFVQSDNRFEGQSNECGGTEGMDGYELVAADGDDAETELGKLLSVSKRLCIAEDSGAGKSVFTRRALAFACSHRGREELFGGKYCLAVRWEEWERAWPADFRQALADVISDDCKHSSRDGVSPSDVVAWALSEGRVLVILDGLDQVDSDGVIRTAAQFLNGDGRNCRAIVTGRPYATNQQRQRHLRGGDWRFARIEGFDSNQIAAYLQGYDVNQVFSDRESVADLLRIPRVLRIVRELLENGSLEQFRTAAELYLQASHHLIYQAGIRLDPDFDERQTRRIEQILAAIAFEMMVRKLYRYSARGADLVHQVEVGASQRCPGGVTENEWKLIRRVTRLTNHCILEGFSQHMLSWQHRGMMEFYCGLHLAGHATDACIQDAAPFANDPGWYWAWRFAIETPLNVAHPFRRSMVIAHLFRRPKSGRRPNELIYLACQMLEATNQTCDAFIPFHKESSDKLELSFVRCPSGRDLDRVPFLMGAPESDSDARSNEKPQVMMTVEPFLISDAPITKSQYWLYDPAHREDPEFRERLKCYSPEIDCPVVFVTWYDAWCFARWSNCRLPTEVEWEYACRAGTTTRYWWNKDFPDDEDVMSKCTFHANRTTPAADAHKNPWGLMEMSGNVYEWCETLFCRQQTMIDRSQISREFRVLRGCSFNYFNPLWLRSSLRSGNAPNFRNYFVGFRVVNNGINV
jgi:formylglycine-generating enzyme required for sulfatase activity